MQQFFTRSKGWDESLFNSYKTQLSVQLSSPKGFLSVDESDFVKKGNDSTGVTRQYCGRLGKTENCQADVFFSYASEKGIGIVDSIFSQRKPSVYAKNRDMGIYSQT